MIELNLDKPFVLLTGEALQPDNINKFVANELSISASDFHPLRAFAVCMDLFSTGKVSLEISEVESLKRFVDGLQITQSNIMHTPFGKAQVIKLLNEALADSSR